MTVQSLFDSAPEGPRDLTLQQRFERFHRENPEVYRSLVRLARVAVRAGKEHVGIGMLWEVLRWRYYLRTVDDSPFRLNNDYRSRYARLIAATEPDLAEIFTTRKLRS